MVLMNPVNPGNKLTNRVRCKCHVERDAHIVDYQHTINLDLRPHLVPIIKYWRSRQHAI